MSMKNFYEFTQNNSGGHFIVNDKLCHRIIIESDTEEKAEDKAFDLGVYYNGVENGMDCPCCGDRWYSPSKITFPYLYGKFTEEGAQKVKETIDVEIVDAKKAFFGRDKDVIFNKVEDYAQYLANDYSWTTPDIRIFYLDGTIKEISKQSEEK